MNRAEMAKAVIVFEELAAALRTELFGEAASEHAQGSTPSWRMGDVTVSSSLSHPSVVIADPAAFLAYVKAVHPSEVETITTTQIRPHFSRALLASLAKVGEPLCDAEGTVIPGVRYDPGGELRSISVKPTADFKTEATMFALAVAAGQQHMTLPALAGGQPPAPIEAEAVPARRVQSVIDDPWAEVSV